MKTRIALCGAGGHGLASALATVMSKHNIEIVAPVLPPEQMAEALDGVNDLIKQIDKRELECLEQIFTRFCLLNGKAINLANVTPTEPATIRPNYYEYWYKIGTSQQYFLMSREIVIADGVPALNIEFNKELAREGEND